VAESFRSGGQHAQLAARLKALTASEYAFLLGRFIDSATLARAEAIAAASGVHPHQLLIAYGWLDPSDYYRALAESCGAQIKADLHAADVAPAAGAIPRQSPGRGVAEGTRPRQALRLVARPRQTPRVA
jgi:hypothetical protein